MVWGMGVGEGFTRGGYIYPMCKMEMAGNANEIGLVVLRNGIMILSPDRFIWYVPVL